MLDNKVIDEMSNTITDLMLSENASEEEIAEAIIDSMRVLDGEKGRYYVDTKDVMVNHPKHYQLPNGMEAIDIMSAVTDDMSGIEAIDTGNALKYIMRWKKKNGLQDIEKAIWYLQHLKKHLEFEEEFKKAMNPPE